MRFVTDMVRRAIIHIVVCWIISFVTRKRSIILSNVGREYGPGTDVSVRYGGSTLYATTSLGTLWAFPHPVKPSSQYQEYFLHAVRRKTTRTQGPTLVQVLCNENRLITAGLDGSIFLLSLASGAGRAATGGAGGGGAAAAATQQLGRGADGGGEKDSSAVT